MPIKHEIMHIHSYTYMYTLTLALTLSLPNTPAHAFELFIAIMSIFQEGERLGRRGFWGDIVVGPYIQFGIECEEQSFFKKANKQLTSVSQSVQKLVGNLNCDL